MHVPGLPLFRPSLGIAFEASHPKEKVMAPPVQTAGLLICCYKRGGFPKPSVSAVTTPLHGVVSIGPLHVTFMVLGGQEQKQVSVPEIVGSQKLTSSASVHVTAAGGPISL